MTRTVSASDLYYQLPRGEWFKAYEQIDKLYPGLGCAERKQLLGNICVYLSRRAKWGDVKKKGKTGRMRYYIEVGA